MLSGKTIGFLGAGNMAEALIKGLITSGRVSAGQILASDRMGERLIHMAETYEIQVLSKNFEVAAKSDIILVTVKPGDARTVLSEIASEIVPEKLLISAAAGVTTTTVLEALKSAGSPGTCPVVRAMPNTPAIVQEGATAVCAGMSAGKRHLDLATEVFSAVGTVVTIDDERLMDAVTGLSGSGPAYVFLFMEALVGAGVKAGLPEEVARALALKTTLGAAKLAEHSDKTLEELRRMVTSPGGTTLEGLKKLDEAGFKNAIESAVEAAAKRAGELSRS